MTEQETPRIRTSDSEREQVAAVLRHAIGEGRLTLAEGEERMAAAYATTYRDELPALTADLPPGDVPANRAAAAGTGRAGEPAGDHATGRPASVGAAGGRLGSGARPRAMGATVLAILAGGWLLASGDRPLWPAIVLGVIALVLFKRARCAGSGPSR